MNQALAIPEPGVLATLNRSEIDGQLAIARQYPRDIERFAHRAQTLATMNETVADECLYALKREDKVIEGPSVRLAEILVSNWGNCRAGARVIEEGAEYIVAQGVFHDLEANAITTFETRRRIVDRKGRRYSIDMVGVTANAACAIALRQAILKGIPKPFWEPIYQAAKAKAIGDAKTLPKRREIALKALGHYGIDEPRVLKVLALERADQMTADHIGQLRGLFAAIRDGEMTAELAFPPDQPAAAPAAKSLDDFAEGKTDKPRKAKAEKPKAEPAKAEAVEPAPANGQKEMPLEANGNKKSIATPPGPQDVATAEEAYLEGANARLIGMPRDQWPAEWRDQHHIEKWMEGWDTQDKAMKRDDS